MALIDGQVAAGLPLDDRGLAYGDGVFETVLVHAGQPVWWREHLLRLRRGAERLAISAPADACWDADLSRLLAGLPVDARVLIKLILTRGSASRGYLPPCPAAPRRIALRLPAAEDMPGWRLHGIRVRWCDVRLAQQPTLAGIKHLNRLEQVLARAEWRESSIIEGLMLDTAGNVVCATAANLFAVVGQRLLTPPLTASGVAGICRDYLLATAGATTLSLTPNLLLTADELFLCSSVRGILPVVALGDHQWPLGPMTQRLVHQLASDLPAFAAGVC